MKVKFKIQGVEFIGEVIDEKDIWVPSSKIYRIRVGQDEFTRSSFDVEIIEEKKCLRLEDTQSFLHYGTDEPRYLYKHTVLSGVYGFKTYITDHSDAHKFTIDEIKEIKSIYGDIFIEEEV